MIYKAKAKEICKWARSVLSTCQVFLWGNKLAHINYGAPFVTCTLLLTEANFVQQKSLLSDKSHFVYDKITFVRQKLILSDKS